MKFTLFATLLAAASAASSNSALTTRLLEDAGGNGANGGYQDIGTGFLMNYDMVFLKCASGFDITNADGSVDTSAAIFRFCPAGEACSSKKATSCSSGYGDYAVGLTSFAKIFLETFNRNNNNNNNNADNNGGQQQQQQQFNLAEYGECRQFKADKYANGGYYASGKAVTEGQAFYIGPACAQDGGSIRLGLFTDAYCTTAAEDITFEDITGMELPYEDGGMVPTDECRYYYCYGENVNNGQMELFNFCTQNYANAAYKCESKMDGIVTYATDNGYDYTPVTGGCSTIATYSKVSKSSSSGMSGVGKAFLIVGILLVVGLLAFFLLLQQRRKKGGSAASPLMK
jgi:hypothetical protein